MEEHRSYLGAVKKYGIRGVGSYSDVHICDYFEAPFLYKEYWKEEYVKFIQDRVIGLADYFFEGRPKFAFPYTYIYKLPTDEYFKGYILEDFENYTDLSNVSKEKQLEVLKKARDLIEEFHNKYGRLHTDICPWNFLYNSTNHDLKLIDFDTNIDLNKKRIDNLEFFNVYTADYIKNVGVDKDLDIFLYNLTVYSLMNNIPFYNTLENISKGNYGVFEDNKHVKNVFESYKSLESPKTLKKEYVIDYM